GLHGQISQIGILVDRDLRPDTRVAIRRPRIVFPRFAAELAWAWDRVPRPKELSSSRIVAAYQPLGVVVRRHRLTFAERGSDADHVLGDGRRRVQPDFSGFEIDRLTVAVHDALFQVHDAVGAE